ncbi:MAG: hypothetical protein LBD31_11110 [Treponema sp.]|jgi:hypothetical protein|nr:hypothetical protein [Treponema sp.]
MAKRNKNAIGIAGEFLAASKLSEQGYAVGVTRKNTPGIDILVSDGQTAKMIQVKTTEGPANVWVCPRLERAREGLFYVFVNLHPKDAAAPSFHVVPSKTVKVFLDKQAQDANTEYEQKNGKPFTGAGVYKFADPEGKHRDQWGLLGLKARQG